MDVEVEPQKYAGDDGPEASTVEVLTPGFATRLAARDEMSEVHDGLAEETDHSAFDDDRRVVVDRQQNAILIELAVKPLHSTVPQRERCDLGLIFGFLDKAGVAHRIPTRLHFEI